MRIANQYKLAQYEDFGPLGSKEHIHLVRDKRSGKMCVKKEIEPAQKEIIEFRRKQNSMYYPRILEFIEGYEKWILIEEYIEGVTLKEYMMGEKLSEKQALEFAVQICQALLPMHHATPIIVYRDLKPENIMVTGEGRIKLVDFNISRVFQQGKNRDTVLLGTAEFAAPEQFGYFQTDNRTDIYAFGILFNYMLTGKVPIEQIAEGKYREVIRKCTEMEPSRRYQEIEEILYVLGEHVEIQSKQKNKYIDALKVWMIPGFRTKKWWKMVVSVLVYVFLISCGLDTDYYNSEDVLYSPLGLWIRRIIMTMATILCVFYAMNYMGIADKYKIFRKKSVWTRVIESLVIGFGIIFAAAVTISVVDMILGI